MNQPLSKWANTEPDAGLPHALLERLAARVPIAVIEELWLFPTRRIATGESTVFVVAAFDEDTEKRRVITARYAVSRDRKGVATVQEQIDEHGIAPAPAVTRIVNGVLNRMDQEGEQPPRAERIERDPDRWWALIEELGGKRPVEPPAPSEAGCEPAGPEGPAQNGANEPAPEPDPGAAQSVNGAD